MSRENASSGRSRADRKPLVASSPSGNASRDGSSDRSAKAKGAGGQASGRLPFPVPLSGESFSRFRPALPVVACGTFLLIGWLLQEIPRWATVAFALSYVSGGYRPAVEGVKALRRGNFDVDLLMVVAALGAAVLGLPLDGAVLIFIFALSNTLEDYALRRSRQEMTALMRIRPQEALVLRNGAENWVKVDELQVGDQVMVRPGDHVPCDGRVIDGNSAVNQAPITGESVPVTKGPGAEVFAGSINETGTLKVVVEKVAGHTVLDRIVELVERARAEKSRVQLSVERFERVYSRAVVVGVVVAWAFTAFVLGWEREEALYRSLVLLIIASPCAIVLSSTPAVLSAMSHGARQGILVKGGAFLELLGRIKVVAFDKTGTLTTGRPIVTEVESIHPAWDAPDIIRVSAALERMVDHPIGDAIVRRAEENGLEASRGDDVQVLAGLGVSGRVAGREVYVGSPARLQVDVSVPASVLERANVLSQQGKTAVLVVVDGCPVGLIAVAEDLRGGARDAVGALRAAGVEKIVMLTGDNAQTAATLAGNLEIEFQANLLPHEKVEAIRRLRDTFGPTMMIGDGVNDGPALAQADVGIAMGAVGTDIALEAADVILMTDDVAKVPLSISLGRRVNRVVQQNLAFSLAVIVVLIGANFAGWLTLPMAVVGHEGSSLLVTLNGLRLLT